MSAAKQILSLIALFLIILSASALGAQASISGRVSSHGNCTYLNGKPLCTGLLVPMAGCTVSVRQSSSTTPEAQSYVAITDKNGNYSIDSVPLAADGDTFLVTASAGPAYSTARQFVALYGGKSYSIDFNLEISFTNTSIVTNDSVSFTVSTDKKTYDIGDSIRVRYSFHNTSTHAIQYYLNIGCQYDLLLTGSSNDTLYWLGRNRSCPTLEVLYSINPDSSRTTQFSPVAVTDAMDSAITATAKMESISITASAVSVSITVRKPVTAVWREAAGPEELSPRIGWAAGKGFVVFLPQRQRISLSLFTTDGRLIRRILDRRILPAGRSEVAVQGLGAAASVYIAVLRGERFSIAETINTAK
jgi:hypothetical protein